MSTRFVFQPAIAFILVTALLEKFSAAPIACGVVDACDRQANSCIGTAPGVSFLIATAIGGMANRKMEPFA